MDAIKLINAEGDAVLVDPGSEAEARWRQKGYAPEDKRRVRPPEVIETVSPRPPEPAVEDNSLDDLSKPELMAMVADLRAKGHELNVSPRDKREIIVDAIKRAQAQG
jgi:hypothetical protein